MKIAKLVPEINWEGRVSQNFDIGLVFVLSHVEEWTFKKITKKIQKLPIFSSRIKKMDLNKKSETPFSG